MADAIPDMRPKTLCAESKMDSPKAAQIILNSEEGMRFAAAILKPPMPTPRERAAMQGSREIFG
jgi:hypothetical protein